MDNDCIKNHHGLRHKSSSNDFLCSSVSKSNTLTNKLQNEVFSEILAYSGIYIPRTGGRATKTPACY